MEDDASTPYPAKDNLKSKGTTPRGLSPKVKIYFCCYFLLFCFLGPLFWIILDFFKYVTSSMFKDGVSYNCLFRLLTLTGFWTMVVYL